MCVSWETRITKVYFFRTCCYQILEEYLVSLAVLWIWENIASLFFPIIDYVWSVPRWLDRHCTRHTCGTQLHSSPLKVKREILYLPIFTLENRKTAQCTPNDPTKLICVTPSEWIRWYRRYDNLKHSLFECVREKMLTLWKREVPYSTFPLELGF